MKKTTFILCLALGFLPAANAQQTENVFLIMTDGLRWQEVFSGADSALLFNEKYTESIKNTAEKFWAATADERRKKLMPFFWNTLASEGQIHGNRWLGSKVDVKNVYGFSYPGYNEILTGYPDVAVNSNDKKYNNNTTILEFLNQQPGFKNKVAAYATWDVFPYIINEPRSGVPVNAGIEMVSNPDSAESLLNDIQRLYPSLASNRHDFETYFLAREHVKKASPRVMFISFDETDEFAHEGKYREYLTAAHTFDGFLQDLWSYCQSTPQYAGKTTFIISTDHGRGDAVKDEWRSHGQKVKDCGSIWLAAVGPRINAMGEVQIQEQLFQNQVPQTIANLLNLQFVNGHSVGDSIAPITQSK